METGTPASVSTTLDLRLMAFSVHVLLLATGLDGILAWCIGAERSPLLIPPSHLFHPPSLPVFSPPNEKNERRGEAPYRACCAKVFHGNPERAPGVQLKVRERMSGRVAS